MKRLFKITGRGIVLGVLLSGAIAVLTPVESQALPAFSRKYDMVCTVCHTRMPRLNFFGQRFLENGYQIPGTMDGGRVKKTLLGGPNGATLDKVSNYMAVRLRADVERFGYDNNDATESDDKVRIQAPDVINFFFAGTATKNISFFFETEYNTREDFEGIRFERANLVFSNLAGSPGLNVKVGNFDPASFFSFPTHRQQMNPVGPEAESGDFPPTINRIPLLPLAFSAKFFGLTRAASRAGGDGYAILPFEPTLFNAPSAKGATLYGRPFGNDVLYQVGVVESTRADGVRGYDYYAMLRYDYVSGEYLAANLTAFYYNSPDSANLTLNMGKGPIQFTDADWIRYGFGARVNYKTLDIFGALIFDRLDFTLPGSGMPSKSGWDDDAYGLSLEANWAATQKWMFSTRYDKMDAGGLVKLPNGKTGPVKDSSWITVQAKYYARPNIALFLRGHNNLESADDSPPRNLRTALLAGVDMAF